MDYDLIIIGSGPAGLSAAQYGARANLKTLVIENGSVGGQVLNINDFENYLTKEYKDGDKQYYTFKFK